MKFFSYIRRRKTIILEILGVIGFLFGFITYFYPIPQSPKLVFYEKQNVDVYKLNDPLNDLEITFKGVDLRKQKKGLKVYSIKLINEGKTGIDLGSQFVGLKFNNGIIIHSGLTKGNDKTLSEIKYRMQDSSRIVFYNFILRPDEYIVLKITVIHSISKSPTVSTIGKFADATVEYNEEGEGNGFWDLMRDLVKAAFYLILGLFGVYIFFTGMEFCSDVIRKEFKILAFKRKLGYLYSSEKLTHRLLKKLYSENHTDDFIEFVNIIDDKEKLNGIISDSKSAIEIVKKFDNLLKEGLVYTSTKVSNIYFNNPLYNMVRFCINEKVIIKDIDNINFIPSSELSQEVGIIKDKIS